MNFEFDFNNLPLAEIKARCRRAAERKDALENELRGRESDLRQVQARATQLRQQTQTLLERLIEALLPDLSATVKFRLAQIFPRQPELFRDSPPPQPETGFWQNVSTFFLDLFGAAPNRLEETRVLLRSVLWQLDEIPPNAGQLAELFRAFLEAKSNYFAHDRMVNEQEAQTNQIVGQLNELSRLLRRCRERIDGRREEEDETRLRNDEDSRIYNPAFDNRPASDTNIIAASTSLTDSSRIDSPPGDTAAKAGFEASGESAAGGDESADSPSDTAFDGFGGGGDFAGGGAGGSWENYS